VDGSTKMVQKETKKGVPKSPKNGKKKKKEKERATVPIRRNT